MSKYIGYDHNSIQRVWADNKEQANLVAAEYFAERADCRKITFRPLSATGAPMLRGSFAVINSRRHPHP